MKKTLMLGNEAVARGLYEAGCRLVSSYPGTPSTEITEYAAEYRDVCPDMYCEWPPTRRSLWRLPSVLLWPVPDPPAP